MVANVGRSWIGRKAVPSLTCFCIKVPKGLCGRASVRAWFVEVNFTVKMEGGIFTAVRSWTLQAGIIIPREGGAIVLVRVCTCLPCASQLVSCLLFVSFLQSNPILSNSISSLSTAYIVCSSFVVRASRSQSASSHLRSIDPSSVSNDTSVAHRTP